MITAIEIIKAITDQIRSSFPDAAVYSDNTKETFESGSFFIEIAGDYSSTIGTSYTDDNLTIRITYFAFDNKQFKTLIKVREALRGMFQFGLSVNETFHITLEDVLMFAVTSDNDLECLLPLHYVQEIPEADGDNIEDVEINL